MNLDFAVGLYRDLRAWVQGREGQERMLELIGAGLATATRARARIGSLHEVEFRVYSQFGDDGIIQWLIGRRPELPRRFVEFGVEDYSEATTRFLLVNNNWSGLVLDASPFNIARLQRRPWFWRHDLTAKCCFVTRENVDPMISEWAGNAPIGILHIDVDGNDYWLWKAINQSNAAIVIVEYNAVFGADRAITIPYQADFKRLAAHYSGQYAGASIAALTHLAKSKGYALIGTNNAGNNAYFMRRDLLGEDIIEIPADMAFTQPKFRESRDRRGRVEYLPFDARQALIRGLPVWNILTDQPEPF